VLARGGFEIPLFAWLDLPVLDLIYLRLFADIEARGPPYTNVLADDDTKVVFEPSLLPLGVGSALTVAWP